MLPSGSGGMEQFYQQVYRRLQEQMARDGAIEINSNEDDVLRALVGAETWPDAFQMSVEQSPGTRRLLPAGAGEDRDQEVPAGRHARRAADPAPAA